MTTTSAVVDRGYELAFYLLISDGGYLIGADRDQPMSATISVDLDESFVELTGSETTTETLSPAAGAVLAKPYEGARRPMPPEDLN